MKRFQTLFYILLGLTMASALAVVIAWQILGESPWRRVRAFVRDIRM